MSRYLFGYEFNATVLVLTRTELHVLTSEKKAKLVEPLAGKGTLKVVVHTYYSIASAPRASNLIRSYVGKESTAMMW